MPELDRKWLEEQFGVIPEVVLPGGVVPDIVIEDLFELDTDEETEKIIKDNIDRANDLLDKVQEEIGEGNFSARVVEVAGQLINSVTQAAKELLVNSNNKKHLLLKEKILMLKKREIDIKQIGAGTPKNQNLIIASREDVLKFLKDPEETEDS